MGRPRSFDEQAVLDAAAAQFRVRGFADTSTEQLCDAAGVRRSSLYNTFTSKDELFARALERYVAVMDATQEAVLTDDGLDGRQRLERLLELIIDEESAAARENHAAGCMVVNSYMSPGRREQDPHVARILDASFAHRLSLLDQAVRIGQADGSLRPGLDARETALFVVTVISGLRVTAQAGSAPSELRRVATLGLGALFAG